MGQEKLHRHKPSVRECILALLTDLFPSDQARPIQSNTDPGTFQNWTGHNQQVLEKRWKDEREGKVKGHYTTCPNFIKIVVEKVSAILDLKAPAFDPFALHKAPGWQAWAARGSLLPVAGDFYQLGTKEGYTKHVGVIVAFDEKLWTTVDSGYQLKGQNFDAIKITTRAFDPAKEGLMGWLNVKEFFKQS
jgi:hypothetical protein